MGVVQKIGCTKEKLCKWGCSDCWSLGHSAELIIQPPIDCGIVRMAGDTDSVPDRIRCKSDTTSDKFVNSYFNNSVD